MPTDTDDRPGADAPPVPSKPVAAAMRAAPPLEAFSLAATGGTDDRMLVGSTRDFPWQSICRLTIHAPLGGVDHGSGFLIGPRAVVTAGHCVRSMELGGTATAIEVVPGRDTAGAPFGSLSSRTYRCPVRWADHEDPSADYAVVVLPAPGFATLGAFGYAVWSDAEIAAVDVNVAGYSTDKHPTTQKWQKGPVHGVSPRRLVYAIDAARGESGAPVWTLHEGKRIALGIHVAGRAALGNYAVRIDAAVKADLDVWLAELA